MKERACLICQVSYYKVIALILTCKSDHSLQLQLPSEM